MKEHLKLVPSDRDKAVYILFPLILSLVEADLVPKKGRNKKILIRLFSSSNGKTILILLIKVIKFYVGFFTIHVRKTSFQTFVLRFFGDGKSLRF